MKEAKYCLNHGLYYEINLTLIPWYRNTLCMASLIASIPRNEKEKLERPPLTLAPGRVCYKKIESLFNQFLLILYKLRSRFP